jgi:hypothetical protein
MFYLNFGKNPTPYEGGREAKNFIKFMSNPTDPNSQKQDPRDEWSHLHGYEHVYFLDDSNFDEFIQSKRRALVMFYAPCNLKKENDIFNKKKSNHLTKCPTKLKGVVTARI